MIFTTPQNLRYPNRHLHHEAATLGVSYRELHREATILDRHLHHEATLVLCYRDFHRGPSSAGLRVKGLGLTFRPPLYSCTVNPTPQTLNPNSLNPKPSTLRSLDLPTLRFEFPGTSENQATKGTGLGVQDSGFKVLCRGFEVVWSGL